MYYLIKLSPLTFVNNVSYTISSDKKYDVLMCEIDNQPYKNKIVLEPTIKGFPCKQFYNSDFESLVNRKLIKTFEKVDYDINNVFYLLNTELEKGENERNNYIVYTHFNKKQSFIKRIFNNQFPVYDLGYVKFIKNKVVIEPQNELLAKYVIPYDKLYILKNNIKLFKEI